MITLRDVQNSPTTEEAGMPDKDNRKDFELAIREVIDGYRKDGVNYNQENLAMALETQAALLRRDDTWGFDSEAAREDPGLQPTTGKSNKQKKAEEDAARR